MWRKTWDNLFIHHTTKYEPCSFHSPPSPLPPSLVCMWPRALPLALSLRKHYADKNGYITIKFPLNLWEWTSGSEPLGVLGAKKLCTSCSNFTEIASLLVMNASVLWYLISTCRCWEATMLWSATDFCVDIRIFTIGKQLCPQPKTHLFWQILFVNFNSNLKYKRL